MGLKLLCDAHAFNNVPSTEKYSDGDVAAQLGLADHRREEPVRDLGSQEPIPVLGERRRIEGLGVNRRIRNHLNNKS